MTDAAPIAAISTARIVRVKLARPFDEPELTALRAALERYTGSAVALQVEIDPAIVGGVWVQVGDTVLDGSVRGQLEALRQHLSSQARAVLSSGVTSAEHEYRT